VSTPRAEFTSRWRGDSPQCTLPRTRVPGHVRVGKIFCARLEATEKAQGERGERRERRESGKLRNPPGRAMEAPITQRNTWLPSSHHILVTSTLLTLLLGRPAPSPGPSTLNNLPIPFSPHLGPSTVLVQIPPLDTTSQHPTTTTKHKLDRLCTATTTSIFATVAGARLRVLHVWHVVDARCHTHILHGASKPSTETRD
jgi:hypothetical protein